MYIKIHMRKNSQCANHCLKYVLIFTKQYSPIKTLEAASDVYLQIMLRVAASGCVLARITSPREMLGKV